MMAFHSYWSRLNCIVCKAGIQKKTESSTHLEMGPIPSALNMSIAVSARLPKTPAEDEQPNARHLSIANAEFETQMTVPGMVRYASAMSQTAACNPGGG